MNLQPVKLQSFLIRGTKVMLDFDVASFYGVDIRSIQRAVKSEPGRFPDDFMFQLTRDEWQALRNNQPGEYSTLKSIINEPPLAFTDQGLFMLSSVLRSDRAVSIGISIMRSTFDHAFSSHPLELL